MSRKGKRVAISAEDLYQDLELWYPYLRFKEEGAELLEVLWTSGKLIYF